MNRTVLMVVALAATSACDTSQPKMKCQASAGPYAATLALTSGSGACAELKGQVLGAAAYRERDGDNRRVALTSQTLVDALNLSYAEGRPDLAAQPNGLGLFDSLFPDEDNFCRVPTFSPAELNLTPVPAFEIPQLEDGGFGPELDDGAGGVLIPPGAEIDGGVMYVPAREPLSLKYEWSNARIYVEPRAPGSQLTVEMKLTQNDCQASYDVRAVWPAVPCATAEGLPDDSLCALPEPYVFLQHGPDAKVVCDPQTLYCVLPGPPPQLK